MRCPTVDEWGSTPAERADTYPCDGRIVDPDAILFRTVDVAAPAPILFRWLCQLRVAPYSYDLLDNFGRRSPRTRDPDLTNLEPGQRFMTLFTLQSFVNDEQITLGANNVAVTYAVRADGPGTRLHVRVLFGGSALLGRALALGDLVMMRKQLLTLKSLAEQEAICREQT